MKRQSAKGVPKPIDESDISDYLVGQDDFALELRCVSMLSRLDWIIAHGGAYQDPITKKMRQFDIRARFQRRDLILSLAVECKALKPSYPLVISRCPRTKEESFHDVIICFAPDEDEAPAFAETTETVRLNHIRCFYDYSKPVGKASVQIGRKETGDFVAGDGETFDKWSQALASLEEVVGESGCFHKANADKSRVLHVAIPVLVVSDNTLWTVDYAIDNFEPGIPQRAEEATLYVKRDYYSAMPSINYCASHLHIFTESGFRQFVTNVSDLSGLSAWFPIADIERISKRR